MRVILVLESENSSIGKNILFDKDVLFKLTCVCMCLNVCMCLHVSFESESDENEGKRGLAEEWAVNRAVGMTNYPLEGIWSNATMSLIFDKLHARLQKRLEVKK